MDCLHTVAVEVHFHTGYREERRELDERERIINVTLRPWKHLTPMVVKWWIWG
jgi:hypothetical protein